jgi:hypothetical protein
MKNVILNVGSLAIIIGLITSCDYINNAVPPSTGSTTGGTTGPTIIYRKALVEDYTGHKCGNCPAAAQELTTLEGTYPNKIVPIAVHAGFFAKVSSGYPTDFQTPEGNTYDLISIFGNSNAGNPNGLINRVGFGTGSFIKQWSSWGGEVAAQIAIPAIFQIKIKNIFNTTSSTLTTSVTVKALASNTGTYKLVVLLTEDSIIKEQLDYSLPVGAQFITNYKFNHVLRGAVNSTWGDAIFSSTIANNDSVVMPYTKVLNTAYIPTKCHVVAYVYDSNSASPTYYEVFQAEEELVK